MLLTTALTSQVTATIRDRGRDYYRSGAVTLTNISPTTVTATVRGSSRYGVDLELDGRTVFASCSCPYVADRGTVCKHIWATIMAAEVRGFAAGTAAGGRLKLVVDDNEQYDDEDDYAAAPPPRPSTYVLPARRPAQESWKSQLDALRRQLQPAAVSSPHQARSVERQPLYLIDVAASTQAQQLVLEVAVQERKKNGDWSKPKTANLTTTQIAELADPLDRQILALLAGAQRGDAYGYYSSSYYGSSYMPGGNRYRLTGLLLTTVMPLLAQTGRLRLRRDPKQPDLEPLVPDPGPPWELALTVSRAATGKQLSLAGTLRREGETIPVSEPALLVPELVFWNGRFAPLNDHGAFAWVPLLRRQVGIPVPAAKADELLTQLLQMPQLPRLDLPDEMRYTEESVPPRPRLVVKAPKNSWGPANLIAELSFVYDGQVVPAQPPGRGVYQSDRKRILLRDPAAERAAAQELNRLGVRPGWSSGGEQKLEVKPAQLPKLARELVTAGWQIEAEGKLYRQPGVFSLAVKSGRDWFDLDAAADFEGHAVPLPRLLEALARGETSVVLDDGTLGMLPEEWLQKYGLLAKLGTVEGDKVRFGRAQVGVLDALLASRPEVTFDKQFAQARDELRRFEGVAPGDPPKGFRGELREYQREGLGWLRFLRRFGFGGCLADDMGLGKTVQVLALLADRRPGPALVVVPRSLVFNWKQEAARFAPGLRVLDHTGTGRDRTGAAFKDHDLVLTTYGTLRNDVTAFSDFRFDTCILDESQAVKNADTESAKAVRLIQADHRLAMSGTPVENHLGELWSLFEFLNPGMLGRAALFGGAGAARNPPPEMREILARALRPFILRRTKDQVAKDLPAKTEQTLYCDLEPVQRRLYDELRAHYRQSLLARVDSVGLGRAKIQVLEALLRLRQAACHPGLIDKTRVTETSAKLDVLLPQLRELAESGRKALVFSQFTSLLSIVKSRLDADGVTYEYLDGRTRDRAAKVERFQTDPDCRLFLISLKAGGVGLNLTAAEYVFLLDPWWNPAVEAQAIDRSHRIGQTKSVFAYRLIARDTVEEKVLALQESKRELADAILGGDGRLITDLKREDLELLLS